MFMAITPNCLNLSVVLNSGEPFASFCVNIQSRSLTAVISYFKIIHPDCTVVASTTEHSCLKCDVLFVNSIDNVKWANNICTYLRSDYFKKR